MTTTATTTFDWTSVAPAWDAHRSDVERMKVEVSRRLLAGLDLHAGNHVLELGAGTGEFALLLADAVSPGGRVIASDVAPGMVALLRATLAGVDGADVAELDASATGLPHGSVDAVAFRMGLMLVERPDAVLEECRRVVVHGGRLGVAVWAGPEHNPWMTCVGIAAMMHSVVTGGPPTGPGGLFSLANPAVLEGAVLAAGFGEVAVHEVATVSRYATADDYFDTVSSLAGPLSAAIAGASEEARAAVRTTAMGLVEQYHTSDGIVVPGRALVCTARAVAAA